LVPLERWWLLRDGGGTWKEYLVKGKNYALSAKETVPGSGDSFINHHPAFFIG